MSVGKASIKRASAATKKKTVEKPVEAVETEVNETAEPIAETTNETAEVPAAEKNRPVRLTEEMPTFLL